MILHYLTFLKTYQFQFIIEFSLINTGNKKNQIHPLGIQILVKVEKNENFHIYLNNDSTAINLST